MRYLEDLVAGERFAAGPVAVESGEMLAFARRYDPQPFHVDGEAAKRTLFGALAASGWFTASLTMHMVIGNGMNLAGGVIARRIEGIEWPRPVYPGDTLRAVSEILEVRPSASRPDRGTIRVRTDTLNQKDEIVQTLTALLVVPARAGGAGNG